MTRATSLLSAVCFAFAASACGGASSPAPAPYAPPRPLAAPQARVAEPPITEPSVAEPAPTAPSEASSPSDASTAPAELLPPEETIPYVIPDGPVVLAPNAIEQGELVIAEGLPNVLAQQQASAVGLYDQGQYLQALQDFIEVQEASGFVELHFNVAITYDRLRKDEQALAHFRAYLRRPDAPRAEQVRQRAETIEAHLAAQRAR